VAPRCNLVAYACAAAQVLRWAWVRAWVRAWLRVVSAHAWVLLCVHTGADRVYSTPGTAAADRPSLGTHAPGDPPALLLSGCRACCWPAPPPEGALQALSCALRGCCAAERAGQRSEGPAAAYSLCCACEPFGPCPKAPGGCCTLLLLRQPCNDDPNPLFGLTQAACGTAFASGAGHTPQIARNETTAGRF
jgi:hypothetical protein